MGTQQVVWLTVILALASFGAIAPSGVDASGGDETLVLLYDTSLGTTLIDAALVLADWDVVDEDEDAGLMRLEADGLLADAAEDLIDTLEALSAVRVVESVIAASLARDYQGKQSIFIEFDDDLDLADVRPSAAYALMNTPSTAPTASSYTPKLAILDGGFSFGHEMLPVAAITAQEDFIDYDSTVTDTGNSVDDDGDGVIDGGVGHGLGMAAAALLVCPHADLYCARVLDDEGLGDNYSIAAGISWAINQGVDVISLSLGFTGYSYVVDTMLSDAATAGIVVVASAGNDAVEGLDFPASSTHTLAVSGVETDGDTHTAMNYDSDVYLSAPSISVPGPFPGQTDDYGWWTGTSPAAAIVAGAMTLAIGENPTSPSTCVSDLETDVVVFGTVPSGRTNKVGAGILDVGEITAP